MNKNYIINGVLGIAVIALFILHFTEKKCSSQCQEQNQYQDTVSVEEDSVAVKLPIAYINSDSLLLNYNYAKELNETLLRKIESSRANLNQKGSKLQADMLEFQKKIDNNAFLSPERAQQEHAGLMKRKQELEEQMERLQQELTMEQMKMNQQVTDTVIAALKIFNQTTKYQVIFNNVGRSSILLLADDAYNITAEVTDYLNQRYIPAKK